MGKPPAMRAALARTGRVATRRTFAPVHVRTMAMAEPLVSPRTAEEEEKLLGQRYGVKPTPGCQLQPPDIHGWTPTPPEAEAAKPVPSVAVVFGGTGMIGKSLLKKIAPKFEKVVVASRNPEKSSAAMAAIGGNIECVQASVEDYDSV